MADLSEQHVSLAGKILTIITLVGAWIAYVVRVAFGVKKNTEAIKNVARAVENINNQLNKEVVHLKGCEGIRKDCHDLHAEMFGTDRRNLEKLEVCINNMKRDIYEQGVKISTQNQEILRILQEEKGVKDGKNKQLGFPKN